jgi:SlyX protein
LRVAAPGMESIDEAAYFRFGRTICSAGFGKGGSMSDETNHITRLEEMLAHQAKTIEELSDQLAEQWKAVEQMRTKLDRLTERFLSLEEQSLDAPAITRPPHY